MALVRGAIAMAKLSTPGSDINLGSRACLCTEDVYLLDAGSEAIALIQGHTSGNRKIDVYPISFKQWLLSGLDVLLAKTLFTIINGQVGESKTERIFGITCADGSFISHRPMRLKDFDAAKLTPSMGGMLNIPLWGDTSTFTIHSLGKSINHINKKVSIRNWGRVEVRTNESGRGFRLVGPMMLRNAMQSRFAGGVSLKDHLGARHLISFDAPPP